MPTKIRVRSKTGTKQDSNYLSLKRRPQSESPSGVHESYFGGAGNQKIETLLTDILTRLDRIEEKIDENVYPPESAIRTEFIKKIKKAHADIKKGKGKTYSSIEDFFKEIEA